jgi:DNA repair exonuclease SbcCD nuclease subunit
MKALVSADWHLKLVAKNVPIEWAKNRYRLLFKEIEKISAKVDSHLLLGDVFDKMPTIEELELFFEFIVSVKIPTYIIGGNHENVKKNTTFLTNLKEVVNKLNPLVIIIDDYYTLENIDFIPYNKLKEWEKDPDNTFFSLHNSILASHCRGDILPHVKAEIDLSLFERWKTVLAGDLHSYSNSQRNILYPGSPVTTSFHRNLVDTGVIIFDTVSHTHEWIKLDLPQLLRKTIKAGDPMVATDYHHTIYEVEGDMSELSNMENSELLDKKVVNRDTDTTLILDPSMNILEEVEEYARYILQLNDDAVEDMLLVLNNYIGELQE